MPTTMISVPAPRFVLDEQARRAAENLVIETDDPVDNPFSERQQVLLTRTLYSSWVPPAVAERQGPRLFWAAENVGVYADPYERPLVPDVFVALDVRAPAEGDNKAYFLWDYQKPPEAVIEIVSNREGNELDSKLAIYSAWGVEYYVVFDPGRRVSRDQLHIFVLEGSEYRGQSSGFLPRLGIGLSIWRGTFENVPDTYLRWCDQNGTPLLTGDERSLQQSIRADKAENRAERLAAKVRELGIDPDSI